MTGCADCVLIVTGDQMTARVALTIIQLGGSVLASVYKSQFRKLLQAIAVHVRSPPFIRLLFTCTRALWGRDVFFASPLPVSLCASCRSSFPRTRPSSLARSCRQQPLSVSSSSSVLSSNCHVLLSLLVRQFMLWTVVLFFVPYADRACTDRQPPAVPAGRVLKDRAAVVTDPVGGDGGDNWD